MRISRTFMRRAWCVCSLVVFTAYMATYAYWSGCLTGERGRLWSFYPPPAGLMNMDLPAKYCSPAVTPWEGWKRWERGPATIFRPCIWLDHVITGSNFLPEYEGAVTFN
jgi:hypothetical protein